ncbi:hypothetical protein PghCCS26_38300 [Paenibacillus glycanilyticus]|uniref:Glycosyl transferase n=1 Tax=Paenibacillus glycanilyticus TaxID=126569 RepID=A0ABQ6NNM3_9BACL|nr:hypothetical protein [Paenibacillus glycanilyticus]GMK46701.1 hypothetical protein PghCCS26_38300 [Paenibacillus glycanilyticus]
MNICTWIYCDEAHEESHYPQVGQKSSRKKFQEVYWKCVATFFATSRRMNPNAKHVLFTNSERIPRVEGFDLETFLTREMEVDVRKLSLTYRVPDRYYGLWKNQFYLFDILQHIVEENSGEDEKYLVLDSDCIWIKPALQIERLLDLHGLLTMTADIDENPDYVMNGLSRRHMQEIYEELMGSPLDQPPLYFGGEWFAAKKSEIRRVVTELDEVWTTSLQRFADNRPKFNEEAQMLSYVYYKLGYEPKTANSIIKRIWTQLYGAHNVLPEDHSLTIWHLPVEKKLGLARLYEDVIRKDSAFWRYGNSVAYVAYLSKKLGIPRRSGVKFILDAQRLVYQKLFGVYR